MSNQRDTGTRRHTVNLKRLQQASRRLAVAPLDEGGLRFYVASAGERGYAYLVELDPQALTGHCSCPWAEYGGTNCKHIMAALQARYRDSGTLSFWRSPEAARRQHRPVLAGDGLFATLRRSS